MTKIKQDDNKDDDKDSPKSDPKDEVKPGKKNPPGTRTGAPRRWNPPRDKV